MLWNLKNTLGQTWGKRVSMEEMRRIEMNNEELFEAAEKGILPKLIEGLKNRT